MKLLKTVFHVHSDYSDDSDNTVEHLLALARQLEIDCLAVTDHDVLEGAFALREAAGPELRVIIGEEISTTAGHLIGLFLREHIEPGQHPRETAKAIKSQGGLVVVPHPFNTIFGCSLRHAVFDILDLVDLVEVSNAQNLLPFPNRRAARLARQFDRPGLVGVDSHHRGSLDACYQWLPDFDGPASFLAATNQATLVPGRHSLGYFAQSAYVVLRYRIGLGTPAGYGRNCTQPRPGHPPQAVSVPARS